MDRIEHFVSTDRFMPHGMGCLWQPGIRGLPVVSDSLITHGYVYSRQSDMPPLVDRVLSKPPKLTALRLALAELTGELTS